eukprot:PITA_07155
MHLTIIQVKPDIYKEKVTIPADKPFIVLSGSGANNTVITWNDSVESSGGTFYSATVSVFASDFMAKYITIQKCCLHTIPELNGAITAQSRSTPSEDTSFTFLNCIITGRGLMYLGRAWGRYSRVVFAYTYIADIIFPEGWDNWKDPSRESTVYYGLYKCSGPGATNKRRVSWSIELNDEEAASFLSRNFIDGQNWIKNMPTGL